MITNREFLDFCFDGRTAEEFVLLAVQRRTGGFRNGVYGNEVHERRLLDRDEPLGAAVYVNVSTVNAPKGAHPKLPATLADAHIRDDFTRKKEDCDRAYMVVLDDVGTKVSEDDVFVVPTYKLETSEGNFQWGYLLMQTENLELYEAIVKELGARGLTDQGATGRNRLVRIPGSKNMKEGKNGWVSRITEWNPDRIWELEDLAAAFKIDTTKLGMRAPSGSYRPEFDGELVPHDEFFEWLKQNNLVVGNENSEFVDIICPWASEHTSPGDTAGYSPVGRGSDEYRQELRTFNCFHEHCRSKKFHDLNNYYAENNGARLYHRTDPLAVAQARYAYVAESCQVADMRQRPKGGTWLWELNAWDHMHRHVRIQTANGRPMTLKNAFLNSRRTRRVTAASYIPGGGQIATLHDQEIVNTYIAPSHAETTEQPEYFLEHLDFLIPDAQERETFIDWLAFKIQNPDKRSYAVVLVAEDAFGIGRSWVGRILQRALEGHVNFATLAQLIGKGTQADANYNDWAAECQFLIVDEAKDVSRDDFFSAYETFKQRVDTSPVQFRANKKYGKTRQDTMWFNALIFSNHADAMVIPEDDRRIAVFTNAVEKASTEYYERLHNALTNDAEARRVYWYLKRRDVSHFNAAVPPMTPAKMAMIQASKSPSEEILEVLVDTLEGDLVTRNTLLSHVKSIARGLGHDQIAHSPGATGRRIWRMLGSLRPGEKNGYRVMIDTERSEIRAVRGSGEWISKLPDLEHADIIAEIRKNSGEPVQFVVAR